MDSSVSVPVSSLYTILIMTHITSVSLSQKNFHEHAMSLKFAGTGNLRLIFLVEDHFKCFDCFDNDCYLTVSCILETKSENNLFPCHMFPCLTHFIHGILLCFSLITFLNENKCGRGYFLFCVGCTFYSYVGYHQFSKM